MINCKGRVIVIDYSLFVHRAGYATKNSPEVSASYMIGISLISCLSKMKVTKEDLVYIACDSKTSWRKFLSEEYKATRKGKREASGLDWDNIFKQSDIFLEQLEKNTSYQVLRVSHCEADDLVGVICKCYPDNIVIGCSYDHDWQLLWYYDNFEIFNPHPKVKDYKKRPENYDYRKQLEEMISQEKSDDLVSKITTKDEYNLRKRLVDLTNLPIEVEVNIYNELDKKKEKENHFENMQNTVIRNRLISLYGKK